MFDPTTPGYERRTCTVGLSLFRPPSETDMGYPALPWKKGVNAGTHERSGLHLRGHTPTSVCCVTFGIGMCREAPQESAYCFGRSATSFCKESRKLQRLGGPRPLHGSSEFEWSRSRNVARV